MDKALAAATSLRACLDYLREGVDGIALRRGLEIDIDPSLLAASREEQDEATIHQAMSQVHVCIWTGRRCECRAFSMAHRFIDCCVLTSHEQHLLVSPVKGW